MLDNLSKFFVNMFGSRNERVVKSMLGTVDQVNRLEPEMRKLSDKALSAKTEEFRNRLSDAFKGRDFTREEADVELNKMLPEAFAVVREAAERVLRTPDAENPRPMRHFDVQLIGGIVLHNGAITEMVTGEGKTLVATLATYLNALPGKGVHVITVNDYLARRDRDWMGPLFEFLGMTAGAIQNRQDYAEKRAAYACDVTYGKDSEFGFDYLRDNMRWTVEEQVQRRGLYYAIVDEVDSVLIDEARTPLIISGPSEESTDKYYVADRVARKLKKDLHFTIKEKERSANLTEEGVAAVEKALGVESIYAGRNADWPHHINQALVAHHLYKRDVKYVAKNGEIVIVDDFTGRLMPGRRWSDGLHQAIEAKEGLRIKEEDQTLATVTYQNLFRLYKKLAGMTGTAMTEAGEFAKIYKLDVVNIPTNLPLIRKEHPDVVYRTEKEKFNAIEEEVVEVHATGRPVLVGTVSIEVSERISDRLKRRGITHEVLNAKHHEREAAIVAKAGQLGNVTIATNMAGRGTDIVLGSFTCGQLIEHWKKNDLAPKDLGPGLPEDRLNERLIAHWAEKFLDEDVRKKVPESEWPARLLALWRKYDMPPLRLCENVAGLGGLHIVGTERHEARRIDNQLRGRAGRQGDPGSSRFFLSLQDDLMRIFASDRVSALLGKIGMEEGMAIEHGMVTRSIERAQKKVEERNFEMRKHLLEYDEVMDEQRKTVYGLRQQIVEHGNPKDIVREMIEDVLRDDLDSYLPTDAAPADRNGRPFREWARTRGVEISLEEWQGADRGRLKDIFRERKSETWSQSGVSGIASDGVAAALDLMAAADRPFYAWDLAGVSRWANKLGLRTEAGEIRDEIMKRLVALVESAAAEQHANLNAETAIQVLTEQAFESYLAKAVAVEEWDLKGLAAWAEGLGVHLPVSQWRRGEEEPEDIDTLQTYTDQLHEQLRSRLERALRDRLPADLVTDAAKHEFARRLELIASAETGGTMGRILSWMEKSLAVSVPESEARSAVAAVRTDLENSLAKQLAEKLGGESPEEAMSLAADNMVETFLARDLAEPERNLAGLCEALRVKYDIALDPFELAKLDAADIGRFVMDRIDEAVAKREETLGAERMQLVERYLLLQKIDTKWKDHLLAMDHLKGGIGLRGYAQVDPKVEYTREARQLFDQMQASVRKEVTDLVLRIQMGGGDGEAAANIGQGPDIWGGGTEKHASAADASVAGGERNAIRRQQEAAIAGTERGEKPQPIKKTYPAVGRNDPCPCGSGKKYKKCHGRAG